MRHVRRLPFPHNSASPRAPDIISNDAELANRESVSLLGNSAADQAGDEVPGIVTTRRDTDSPRAPCFGIEARSGSRDPYLIADRPMENYFPLWETNTPLVRVRAGQVSVGTPFVRSELNLHLVLDRYLKVFGSVSDRAIAAETDSRTAPGAIGVGHRTELLCADQDIQVSTGDQCDDALFPRSLRRTYIHARQSSCGT
jgi:hypothetical protein